MRRALRTLLIAAPALVLIGTRAGAQEMRAREPVILDLRIAGVGSRTVRAWRTGDEALLPATALLELGEVRYARGQNGVLEIVVEPRGTQIVLDAGWKGVLVDGVRRAGPEVLVGEDDEVFVPAALLGDALGATIDVDWSSLTATIANAAALPVGRRLQRQRARARFLAPQRPLAGAPAGGVALGLERPRLDGMVVDYAVSAGGPKPLRAATYLFSTGANVFGGALEATVAGIGDGPVQERLSWLGVWRGASHVQQVRLGDGYSTGPRFRAIRGAMVTNAPFFRPPLYSALDFGGRLAPGWQLEVYRDGQLVAIDSTGIDGSFGVTLPALYGETAVDFVAYGPFGEEIAFNRSLSIPLDLLPAGRAEYGLAAGRCTAPPCDAEANLDLRYGLTDRWTLRGGVDHTRADTLGRLTQGYAALTGSVTNALQMQLSGIARDNARLFVQYRPSLFLRLTGSATRFDDDRPVLVGAAAARSTIALSGTFALPRPRGVPRTTLVDAAGEVSERAAGRLVRSRLGVSTQTRIGRITPYARLEQETLADGRRDDVFSGLETSIVPSSGAHPLLRGVTLRAMIEGRDGDGFHAASVWTSKTLSAVWQLDLGGSWLAGTRGASLSLLLSAVLPTVRSYTSVHAPPSGRTTATQYASGSIVWNRPDGRVALSHQSAIQRAGVTGRVYVDANGNGSFDAGEETVPSSYVRIGATGAIADSSGRYALWNILPFEPVAIEVDSLTIPSPLWVPAAERMTAELGPNRFQPVDIPLVFGGTVEGTVRREGRRGIRALPAAPVAITELRTGRTRVVTAFNDGDFAAYPLRPGDYVVTVADSLLRRLGGTADTVRFTVRSLAEGDRITGVEIMIRSDARGDDDGDGVPNGRDRCAGTPARTAVDAAGCAPPVAECPPDGATPPPEPPRELPPAEHARSLDDCDASILARFKLGENCPVLFTERRRVVVLEGLEFEPGSAAISPASRVRLDSIALALVVRPWLHIVVEGHTDSTGSRRRNLALSRERAEALATALVARGADAEQLEVRGAGPDRPIASSRTAAGRRLNRRVELHASVVPAPYPAGRTGRPVTPTPASSGSTAPRTGSYPACAPTP